MSRIISKLKEINLTDNENRPKSSIIKRAHSKLPENSGFQKLKIVMEKH